jgi:uncharacterized membrane protein
MTREDMMLAEKLIRRRARVSIIFGIIFLLMMLKSLGADVHEGRVETFRLASWILWAASLLTLLAFGGGLLRGKTVRGLMNDDSTLDNRQRGMVAGFWVMVIAAFALYAYSMFEPVSGRDAIRLLLSAAVGASIIRFGILEKRSIGND